MHDLENESFDPPSEDALNEACISCLEFALNAAVRLLDPGQQAALLTIVDEEASKFQDKTDAEGQNSPPGERDAIIAEGYRRTAACIRQATGP